MSDREELDFWFGDPRYDDTPYLGVDHEDDAPERHPPPLDDDGDTGPDIPCDGYDPRIDWPERYIGDDVNVV
jgi:hypothetical protein